jgi:DNA polymerase-1
MLQAGIECHLDGIRGYGDPSYKVMIVGISPGANETRQGQPFVGMSGKILNVVLSGVKWPREQVYCTNLVCTEAPEPTASQLLACAPRLAAELDEYKPKLVITLGKLATERFTNLPMKRAQGQVIWNGMYYILGTYHPAAVLHGGSHMMADIIRDLSKIPAIINDYPNDGQWPTTPYTLCTNPASAQAALRSAATSEYAVVDIETTNPHIESLDTFVDRLLCLSVCTGDHTYVFTPAACEGLIWPLQARWTFHNGMFDSQGIRRYLGVSLPVVEDTMLMSYSVDERSGRHGLKRLAREYCGADYYEDSVGGENHKDFQGTEPTHLWEYNAKDAQYTYKLINILKQKQATEGSEWFYSNLLIPAANVYKDITYRGAHVNLLTIRNLTMDFIPRWKQSYIDLQQSATAEGFPGEINLNSPKQLSVFLYNILGLPGGPTTNRAQLELLQGTHPFIDHFMKHRQLDHVIRAYLLGIMDDIKPDRRVHANVLLHGTVTGRLAYREPPLQTLPKAMVVGDDLARVRRIFDATNDNYCIMEADYEKAEVWCAQYISGDTRMLSDLQSVDFHSMVASNTFRVPYEEVTEKQRFNAKAVTFGVMYGRGAASLAHKELNCDINTAERFIRNWFDRYPQYTEWYERTKVNTQRTGIVTSPLGRKRRFYFIMSDQQDLLNQAVNFPIQSLASDCTLSSTIELHTALAKYDSFILWSVHDSIIMEVNKRYVRDVYKLVTQIMSKPRFDSMPGIPIEVKIGPNVGEGIKYNGN